MGDGLGFLAFDRTRGHAAHKRFLQQKIDDQTRDQRQECPRQKRAGADFDIRPQAAQNDRDRVIFGSVGRHQRQ